MSCWEKRRPTTSFVSKLDLTLCRQKPDRFHPNGIESTFRDFETVPGIAGNFSSIPALKKDFTNVSIAKNNNSSSHCSRIDITLEQKNKRKVPVKCPSCTCSSSTNHLQMPWRYSSSCKDAQGIQPCLGQSGFASDHGCELIKPIPIKQHFPKMKSTSCFSADRPSCLDSANDNVQHTACSPSRSQSSWTSRLDVVLANNSPVSKSQKSNPYAIFTSCNQEQSRKDYEENVTQISNINGVNMYISSCSLTVHPFQPKCQGGNDAQSVFLMPTEQKCTREYAMGFQPPQKGFIMSETPTFQITQFQVTRSPASPPPLQQTSSKGLWMSPDSLPRVSGSSGHPDIMPNVVVFQRSCSPVGRRTDLYPVLIPTQQKASKITLLVGSPVAPVPVQVFQEYNRSPTPAIFISNGDQPASPEDLGSGFLLSVNPIGCPKPRHMEAQRPSSRCKPPEPYPYHPPSCTVMPRVANGRESNAPVAVSIETYGSRRGAVRISISHSSAPNSFGMRS